MVSPQEGQSMVGAPVGLRGVRSMAEVDGMTYGICASPLKQAGALPNSQPPTPGTVPLSMIKHM